MLNYLDAVIEEEDFIDFLNELCALHDKYAYNFDYKEHFFNLENVHLLLESGYGELTYSNIDPDLIQVKIYIKNKLKKCFTTSVADEVHTATIFMGTRLFSNLNKICISDVSFKQKKQTEIYFLKTCSQWNLIIDIIM